MNTELRTVPCGLVHIKQGHGEHTWQYAIGEDPTGAAVPEVFHCNGVRTAKVVLFKTSGKYYTEEYWRIPEKFVDPVSGREREPIGPHDMEHSPDFRRIDNGPVLVESQEPWGYPCLLPGPTLGNIFAGHKPGCR